LVLGSDKIEEPY